MPSKEHVIRSGETLSGIAGQYGFSGNWKPIWNYNTKVRKTLTSGDPDLIRAGVKITIPRTSMEYDVAISRLTKLLAYVDIDKEKNLRELRGYKAEADTMGARVDLAADVAFAIKGSVKASIKYGPRLAKVVMRKEALSLISSAALSVAELKGSSNEELVIQSVGTAYADSSLFRGTKIHGDKLGRHFRKNIAKSFIKKAATTVAKTVAPVEKASGFAEAVGFVCDLALKGVEAVSPSNVAKLYVWARTGEHPADTYASMQRLVSKQAMNSRKRLEQSIKYVHHEKATVYG